MSASTTPTLSPSAAIATARLAVTDDLPTPPLPDAIAYTLVSEPGCANGITGSASVPRSSVRNAERCSADMTPNTTETSSTPSTVAAAALTSRVRVSFSGQPGVVRSIPTVAREPTTSTERTMPSSVIGRLISGSRTCASASRMASSNGSVGSGMRPW